MKFVEQDNNCTSEKEKEAEQQLNTRKLKEKDIKELDSEIQNLKSEIEKNKDVLSALEDHKEFLINLPFSNLPSWLAEQERIKEEKRKQIKRRWIDFHKNNTRDDHIIFREEDDYYNDKQIGNPQKTEQIQKVVKRGGQGTLAQKKRETMNDKDWDLKFEQLWEEDLIDIPEDYFNERLFYSDPNELSDVFSDLEEKNLYLIHQSQEVEQSLETLKQQYENMKKDLGNQMRNNENDKMELDDKISEAKKNLNDLKRRNQINTISTQGGNDKDKDETEVNIEELLKDLTNEIRRVYSK